MPGRDAISGKAAPIADAAFAWIYRAIKSFIKISQVFLPSEIMAIRCIILGIGGP